jgi:3-polyprenyl-4-hydroxybenzoate decarboxylase
VVGVECPESAGGSQMCVIRMKPGTQDEAWEALEAAPKHIGSKWLIAVDEDVYPSEPELLLWAMTYSIRSPQEAVRYQTRRGPGLDPSADPPDGTHPEWTAKAASPLTVGLINAVRPWDYPPVALPARKYMERALELWKRAPGAPELNLKAPWYGYELGYWPDPFKEIAQLMADGDFLKAGELLLEYQTPLTDKAAEQMTHAF